MPITKATLADASELTALINSAYRGTSSQQGWTSEAHLLDGIRIDKPTMLEYLQADKVTMLKYTDDEGQILACVYLEVRNDNRLYLGMLTVSPRLQANGIGRQLLHEAEVWATSLGCPHIFMTVITTRHELIAWYQRRGYRNTGKIQPFPTDTKFGVVKNDPIELVVLEKEV
ncbi:MAG TPA: GNAT family N-acetyltransferase [Mucilaginibacter sp.]|nr:GNAT family N-acetyltransferase [Mucilaginibacter sp.]